MASRELKVEIIGDASSLKKALGNATDTSSKFGSTMAKMGKMAAVGLGALGVGAVIAGKQMIGLASDAAEVESKMQVIFGKELPQLTKNLDAFSEATGASKFALREQAADMGALLAPLTGSKKAAADMSAEFVKLATDLGSFNNVPVDDALLAIRSGLVGETEPLRRFGILLNEAAVNAEGLRQGLIKEGEVMTEGEKVLARRALILKQSSLAQGDATRTAGSMANQMKALQNNVTDMATSLGTLLIPYALAAAKAFNDNWPQIEAVVKAVLTGIITGVTAVVTAVQYLRGQWEIHRESAVAAWEAVRTAVLQFVQFFQTSVIPAMQNVVSAAKALWANFGGELTAIGGRIVATVKAMMQNMLAPIKIILALLRGDWTAAWEELRGVVTRTLGTMIGNIRAVLGAAVSVAVSLAGKIGKGIIDGILDGVRGLAAKVGEQMQKLWDALRSAASTAYQFAYTIGAQVIEGIWNGVKAKIDWLKGMIEDALGFLKSLSPFSTVAEGGAKYIGAPIIDGAAKEVERKAPELAKVTEAAVRKAVGAAALAAATKEIGGKMVQDIIDGIVGKTPSLKEQFATAAREAAEAGRQAIVAAREGYADAFASLYQAGFDAIAAKYAGWVPPSLLKAQKEAEAREKAQLLKSISDTQEELKALIAQSSQASKDLQALGLRPADLPEDASKEAQKQRAEEQKKWDDLKAIIDTNGPKIVAAQENLDGLLFQQRQKHLQELAKIEQDDHDKKVAKEQENFGKRLQKIMASHKNVHAKVMQLLKDFDIDFLNAGLAWGNALAQGIRDAKQEVKNAAQELAQIAKNNLQNNSPKPKEGPLSRKSMFDAGREHGMNWAKGIASASGAAGKAASTTAGGASGGFGDAKGTGNIFSFGSGTVPPGGYAPDFEGSKPAWADRELWDTIARMAAGQGKFDALIEAVQSGSIKANAGLLSQLFYARTRKTWNDFPARIARILDDMRGPEGLSSAEAAAKYGLRTGGRVLRDGAAWLHKGEDVIPPGQGMRGKQEININFNGTVMGGTEAQMARVLAPAIENEIRRSQRRGNASIVQAT